METANSHYDVKIALSNITAHLLADKSPTAKQKLAVEVLYTLKWETAFERYKCFIIYCQSLNNGIVFVLFTIYCFLWNVIVWKKISQ